MSSCHLVDYAFALFLISGTIMLSVIVMITARIMWKAGQ